MNTRLTTRSGFNLYPSLAAVLLELSQELEPPQEPPVEDQESEEQVPTD